jgi:hypothetical protein
MALLNHITTGADEDTSVTEHLNNYVFGDDSFKTDKNDITPADATSAKSGLQAIVDKASDFKKIIKALDKSETECNKAADKAGKDKDATDEAKQAALVAKEVAMHKATIGNFMVSAVGKIRSEYKSIILASISAGRHDKVKNVHGEGALFSGVL